MDELLTRFWDNLIGRLTGPLQFRLILQPAMAALFAIRDGLKDARAGRPAYLWTVFTNPTERQFLLHEGWKAVAKVFILAIIIDAIYQLIALRWFYPGEAVIVAIFLALVPYGLLRGPINRIARRFVSRPAPRGPAQGG